MENVKAEEIRIKKEMLLRNQKKYSNSISNTILCNSPSESEKLKKYKENRLNNLDEFKQQQVYKGLNSNFSNLKNINSNLCEQNSLHKINNIANKTFSNNFYSSNSSTRKNSLVGMNSTNYENFVMNSTTKSQFGSKTDMFNKTQMRQTGQSFFNPNKTGGFGKTFSNFSQQNENNNSNISEFNILRPQTNLNLQNTISNIKYESMVKNLKSFNHRGSNSISNNQNFSSLNTIIPPISNNTSVINNNEIKSSTINSQTIQSGINQNYQNHQNYDNEDNNKKEENLELNKLYRYLVKGHTFKSQRTKSFKNISKEEKEEILKKFNLSKEINKVEKEKLITMIDQNRDKFLQNTSQMKRNLPRINVIDEFFYKDPLKSYKNVNLNKQLYDNMLNMMTSEQIKKYDEIYSNVS